MRKAVKIASASLQAVVIVVAVAAAAILLVPRLLGWQVVTVLSGSMEPTYPADAVLAVDPVNPVDIREGDVIAFVTEADRPMVTHRVVDIKHDASGLSFTTKGDANEDTDHDPVPASAVRGRVVFGVPYLGWFVRTVHNPIGFAVLLVVPALLLIGQELLTMRRDRRAGESAPAGADVPLAADATTDPDIAEALTDAATRKIAGCAFECEVRA